ncbi:hypothetical protein Poli38472_003932 [Pythium oligandrum]|uniref:Uncharacterized protein n=1 Tax=Pythium oligandrum TaxID=41045 RepID=A0A8K1FNS0_PYTOL|nr:hypothetical protein Poli38472_003932 [Pythium oligandrum]|eukprot:TMW66167.1 hypothetical protein Poli38472_003932 [Pythium oligandrum]
MVRASDANPDEVRRVNQQLEERHYEFRSNCNDGEGDASACHSWGEWLAVVDKNYKDAAAMYALNCDKNNYPASCFNLGRLKLAGKGVEMNDTDAIDLFEKSCKGGHAQGCHHLGFMFCKGLGRDKNILKGVEAFKEACEREDANSCNKVASMYLSGAMSAESRNPIKRDAVMAKTYLEKACDANFAPACHNLAVMFKKGDVGVEQSDAKYEEYRKKTNDLIAQAGGMSSVKAS